GETAPPGGAGSATAAGTAGKTGRQGGRRNRRPDAAPRGGDEPGAEQGGKPDEAGVRPDGGRGDGDGTGGPADAGRPDDPSAEAAVAGGEGEALPSAADRPEAALRPADLNHVIARDDTIVPRGEIGKIRANIAAIELLQQLEADQRNPTPEEKRTLAQFTGWGQLRPVFDSMKASHVENLRKRGSEPTSPELANWAKKYEQHYRRLRELLSDQEWRAAAQSSESAHYTSREAIAGL